MATFDLDAMLTDLAALVEVESPSLELAAIERSAAAVAEVIERRLGSPPELVPSAAGPHVHWRGGGEPRVLLVGHHDTVFRLGTLASRPFTCRDGMATGPGVFDMKGGIVLAVHAVAALTDRSGVELLITSDEEVGSGASRELIEARAESCGAVLVLEPAADGGALKTGRKGTGSFVVTVRGRAAHAGLEPEKGVNALVEAAHQVVAIAGLGDAARGTTVTPTVAHAGTAENVVPAEAVVRVDVRISDLAEAARVEVAMRSLAPVDARAGITVTGGVNRPPMEEAATAELYAVARRVADAIGVPAPGAAVVGGGSDGNFTAARGIPTLDGLGAVGGGAHTDDEFVLVDTLVDRARLLAGLIHVLTASEGFPPPEGFLPDFPG